MEIQIMVLKILMGERATKGREVSPKKKFPPSQGGGRGW